MTRKGRSGPVRWGLVARDETGNDPDGKAKDRRGRTRNVKAVKERRHMESRCKERQGQAVKD